jgi:hypothetical protein
MSRTFSTFMSRGNMLAFLFLKESDLSFLDVQIQSNHLEKLVLFLIY